MTRSHLATLSILLLAFCATAACAASQGDEDGGGRRRGREDAGETEPGPDGGDRDAGSSEGEGEGEGEGEICDNYEDDDGDYLWDCEDDDCFDSPDCIEDCTNGIDDNGDYLTDCEDPVCDANEPTCVETNCNNLVDDEGNGLFDCYDEPDCKAASCTPGATPTGGPCSSQTDCSADDTDPFCLTETDFDYQGGACSEFCTPGEPGTGCTGDAVCLSIGYSIGLCFDGCASDPDCTRTNYVCESSMVGVAGAALTCQPHLCGDGLEVREECDDENAAAGDGCSTTCTLEVCDGTLPELVLGTNTGNNSTSGFSATHGTCQLRGARENVYGFTPPGDGELTLTLTSAADLGVSVRSDCASLASELGCADAEYGGDSYGDPEVLEVDVGAAPLTVLVDGYDDGEESAWELELAFVTANCGDGAEQGSEACDGADLDGGRCRDAVPETLGTLSCNADCTYNSSGCVPIVLNETEPNDTPAAPANAYSDPFLATFASATDVDCVSVSGTRGDLLSAAVRDFDNGECADYSIDAAITVYAPDGTTVLGSDSYYCASVTELLLDADGTYFVCAANAGSDADIEGYRILVTTRQPVCGDNRAEGLETCDGTDVAGGSCYRNDATTYGPLGCLSDCSALDLAQCVPIPFAETEQNGTAATANPYTEPFLARIDPAGDVDCVSVDAAVGDRIIAHTADLGDGACDNYELDTVLDVYNGATAVYTDDDYDYCATVVYEVTTAGTYAICARASSYAADATFAYDLQVNVGPPACGDGLLDGGEDCDDGNNLDGDDCSATCEAEACLAPREAQLGTNTGDTTQGSTIFNIASDSQCFSAATGRSEVWTYVPATGGTLSATVTPGDADTDPVLYARSACGDPESELGCADDGFWGGAETLSVSVSSGVPVFLVVDANSWSDADGPYTLVLTQP